MPYKDGRLWRGVVKIGGKRVSQKSFDLKRDASEWEREERKRIARAEKSLRDGLDLLTFCSKYQIYIERFSKQVRAEKKAVCERLIIYFGKDTLVSDITEELAEEYLSKQKAARSAYASNRDRKNLRAMWVKGKKTWGVNQNPFAETVSFPHDRLPQYTPPSKDVLKVLMAATRPEKVFLYAYIQTGARRSEIFRWTWLEDINFDRRQYRLGTRKTRDGSMSYEWFPMGQELYDELFWWWNNRTVKESPYVFVNDHEWSAHYGEPYTYRRKFMSGICKRAGVKTFHFHALRRFCASMLSDAGKSTNAIRRFLRHKNVRTTEIYIQNINDDMQDVADALSMSKLFPVPESGTRDEGAM